MPAASCTNEMPAFGAAINGSGEPLTGTAEAKPLTHGKAARLSSMEERRGGR